MDFQCHMREKLAPKQTKSKYLYISVCVRRISELTTIMQSLEFLQVLEMLGHIGSQYCSCHHLLHLLRMFGFVQNCHVLVFQQGEEISDMHFL